jgi:hypothetical protein
MRAGTPRRRFRRCARRWRSRAVREPGASPGHRDKPPIPSTTNLGPRSSRESSCLTKTLRNAGRASASGAPPIQRRDERPIESGDQQILRSPGRRAVPTGRPISIAREPVSASIRLPSARKRRNAAIQTRWAEVLREECRSAGVARVAHRRHDPDMKNLPTESPSVRGHPNSPRAVIRIRGLENVPGANGSLGVGRVARAAPDGYTLVIGYWGTHVAAGSIGPLTATERAL